ncbi:hypothetical protein PRIPAC_93998, partial [Pristionchus pacificus]|uniref:Uncharacterized protein n=1 Tax=Pristionchus pacificus TaxID=54126 RepID=A0A2A6CCZ4_PRIPA
MSKLIRAVNPKPNHIYMGNDRQISRTPRDRQDLWVHVPFFDYYHLVIIAIILVMVAFVASVILPHV